MDTRSDGRESPRRAAVVALLVTFWATLLVALGVPGAVPILLGALAGSGLVAVRAVRRRVALPALPLPRGLPARVGTLLRAVAVRTGLLGGVVGRAGAQAAGAARATFARTRGRVRRPALVLAPPGARDRAGEAWRFCRTGAALRQQGRAVEAVECCETAVWLFRDLDEPRGLALALNGLGLALVRQGRPEAAIGGYEEAASLLGSLGERHAQGQVLANLGAALSSQGRSDEARASWENALERLDPGSAEYARTGRELRATA
jgi:hypothetical protein